MIVQCGTLFFLTTVFLVFLNAEAEARVHFVETDGSNLIVDTNVGSIRGLRADDGNYSMFMGIPYAEVDKDNPFSPAKPYPKFEQTFEAFDDTSICPQIEEFNNTIVGSLDCLHLNIYVPDSASEENKLPVFVWIYGGGFSIGFAGRFLYGPSFLVRHDVILVTLNYRLGPYGFMCLDIPEVPGNQGLKDQVLALRWIKANIAAFGGDNTKITIAGNSAGGTSADLHLYSAQQEENLFDKIVLQSGVALNAGSVGSPDPTAPIRLTEYFNYTPIDTKDALSYLATRKTDEIIAAINDMGAFFLVCVENKYDDVENFITKRPINSDLPEVENIDVLIGFNNEELYTIFASLPDIVYEFSDFVGSSITSSFNFENNEELLKDMKEIVTHFYFGDENINAELKQQVQDMTSDFAFNHPTLRTVKKYLESGVGNLYLYLFSYSGRRNFVKDRIGIEGGGAGHADEIGYLFDISYMEKPMDPEDELIVDRMTVLWTNFAKYGNPTPEPTELIPTIWPAVSKEKWHYLDINSELRVSTRPYHARMAFLDLFYKKNEEYQIGFEQESAPSAGRNVMFGISLPLLLAIQYFL